jgi:hypothetical protein
MVKTIFPAFCSHLFPIHIHALHALYLILFRSVSFLPSLTRPRHQYWTLSWTALICFHFSRVLFGSKDSLWF